MKFNDWRVYFFCKILVLFCMTIICQNVHLFYYLFYDPFFFSRNLCKIRLFCLVIFPSTIHGPVKFKKRMVQKSYVPLVFPNKRLCADLTAYCWVASSILPHLNKSPHFYHIQISSQIFFHTCPTGWVCLAGRRDPYCVHSSLRNAF